ncbi:MAG: FecR family protein [Nitrospirota bacterium]
MKKILLLTILLNLILTASGSAVAADTVGSFVAIRGKALIDRERKTIEAQVKDGIFLNDTVSTRESSRAKMLFIDDSVLTLGEKSRAAIKEYVYSREKGGKSIINLLDGKMRAIVGKTSFEIHTPTAVAAARGTIILCEVGIKDGKQVTTFICVEGEFTVTGVYPGSEGSAVLKPGMKLTIVAGEPFPSPILVPGGETETLLGETGVSQEISIPGPAEVTLGPGWVAIEQIGVLPPIDQQPGTIGTTPVTIDVIFP